MFGIESGYFVFTLMPSLRCSLNCPHCYLSLEQRRNSEIMSIKNLQIACQKVDDYYHNKKNIVQKHIVLYWYGGEPTEMGIDYFNEAVLLINSIFTKDKGYTIKHTVLTSLLTISEDIWFPFFQKNCNNHFQTSFDGLMRGKGYVRKWENKVKSAISSGLDVGTISVVNQELLRSGAKETLDYLSELGIKESSFLPFMWNEQNDGEKFERYAPSMTAWNDFMIDITKEYLLRKEKGLYVPEIGQLSFVLHQSTQPPMANIAGQTLFLLPDGEFVLPDYRDGYKEYMRSFGNILHSDFNQILKGKERTSYLKKQVLRNNNKECLSCDYSGSCVMEFWKENRKGDECFGGYRYVEWVMSQLGEKAENYKNNIMY